MAVRYFPYAIIAGASGTEYLADGGTGVET